MVSDTLGQVVITIFFSAMRWLHHTPAIFYVFWNADSESDIENLEFEKEWPNGPLKFLQLQWENKKPNFNNFNKKRSYRLQMTRGFQIWSQNLNWTMFDSLFDQKRSKTGFC